MSSVWGSCLSLDLSTVDIINQPYLLLGRSDAATDCLSTVAACFNGALGDDGILFSANQSQFSQDSFSVHYTVIIDDIALILQQNRLPRYGHVLRKDDDWVKKCMEYEAEGPRPRGRPKRGCQRGQSST